MWLITPSSVSWVINHTIRQYAHMLTESKFYDHYLLVMIKMSEYIGHSLHTSLDQRTKTLTSDWTTWTGRTPWLSIWDFYTFISALYPSSPSLSLLRSLSENYFSQIQQGKRKESCTTQIAFPPQSTNKSTLIVTTPLTYFKREHWPGDR